MSGLGDDLTLRPLRDGDVDEVLALNQHWVPHVGTLDREVLVELLRKCCLAVVARTGEGAVARFALVVAPGADYHSPTFRFFQDRSDDFRYVDRIAVAPSAQGDVWTTPSSWTRLGRRCGPRQL